MHILSYVYFTPFQRSAMSSCSVVRLIFKTHVTIQTFYPCAILKNLYWSPRTLLVSKVVNLHCRTKHSELILLLWTFEVFIKTVSCISYGSFPFARPIWRHLHLFWLNNICHLSDHWTNLFKYPCIVWHSCLVCTILKMLASSTANLTMLLATLSSKSFIIINEEE